MIILKIILIMLGLIFTKFGYEIYFRKKYNLINGFKDDFNAGRKTQLYAKRVGLIEFIIGIILVLIGICVIVVK